MLMPENTSEEVYPLYIYPDGKKVQNPSGMEDFSINQDFDLNLFYRQRKEIKVMMPDMIEYLNRQIRINGPLSYIARQIVY